MGDHPIGNEFSGSASTVVQIGAATGPITLTVPPVPEPSREVPHQVPAADSWFVNRSAEIANLENVARPTAAPRPRIALVTGVRGVGKTALVRQWVDTTAGQFPGGELYVDFAALRSRSGTGAAVGEALAGCLQGLGVPERHLPGSLSARVNLFRTRTADRPVLVILDDVTEEAQVAALVPRSAGSAVVATCDRRLGEVVRSHGAELLVIEPLDAEYGRELLITAGGGRISDADPAAVAALVRLCGGLPIALRVAAARLQIDRSVGVADLVAEVTSDLDALSLGDTTSVAGVFTAAYRALPAAAARAYRLFGLTGGMDLSQSGVSIVLGVPPAAARATLSALLAANLVDDAAPGRYRLHALVARHAANRAERDESPAQARAALRRLVHHYVVGAMTADRRVMGDRLRFADLKVVSEGVDPPDVGATGAVALEWLAAERRNLLRAVRLSAASGWDELTWPLAEALAALYLHRRRPHELIEVCRAGMAAAERLNLVDVGARLRCVASRGYLDLGMTEQAASELSEALRLTADGHDLRLLASVWEFRGRLFDHEAAYAAGQASGPASGAGRAAGQASGPDPEAGPAASSPDLKASRACAIDAYRRSLAYNLEAGETRGAGLARYFLGSTLKAHGCHQDALPLLQQAVADFTACEDARLTARAEVALGSTLVLCGDPHGGARALRRAVVVLANRGLWRDEVQGLEVLAAVTRALGDHAEATALLQRAAALLDHWDEVAAARVRASIAGQAVTNEA